jgi:hypothetical protein
VCLRGGAKHLICNDSSKKVFNTPGSQAASNHHQHFYKSVVPSSGFVVLVVVRLCIHEALLYSILTNLRTVLVSFCLALARYIDILEIPEALNVPSATVCYL